MNLLKVDGRYPQKGTPEYRLRYWALIGVRVLSMAALLVSIVFVVLGRPPVSTIAAVVEIVGLLAMVATTILLRALIRNGQTAVEGEQESD